MNIEASLPAVGMQLMAECDGVSRDLARITSMWSEALQDSGGPYLFGEFSAVDAFYAPVVARLRSYALPVPLPVADYMTRVWSAPGVAAWVAGALAEQDWIAEDEPYRQSR
jgi:glutathione S-transferase